ncbi:MAG: CoA transferase [Dehalococcoidia bacterium]
MKEHPIDAAHGGQASYVGGLYAAIALLQAVAVARSSGHAIHNDVSLQSALAAMMVLNVPWFTYAGVAPSRQRSAGRPGRAMGGFIRVKDGRVAITMIEEHQWDGLVRALGAPEWTALPTFTTQLDRSAHWDGIRAFLEEEWRGLTTREVMERCQAENVPVFTVREMDEILASAHEAARGFFAPSEPDGVMLPTNPWMIDGAALGSRGRSPGIGEHTRAALTMLGLSDEDFDAFHEAGVI